MLRGIGRTIAALVRPSRFEQEMREELRAHIEHRADDLVRSGVGRDDAVRQARLEFGGVEACKEECRDARGFAPMRITNGLWMDLRLAARRLAATPLFLLFATLSLALGIGITTTAYSLLYSLMWKPPAIGDFRDLALVTSLSSDGSRWRAIMSRQDFDDLRAAQRSFSHLAASAPINPGFVGPQRSEIVDGEAVTGNYFQTLGVKPVLGRTIQRFDDARPDAIVVLSHRLWQMRFEGDPAIVGRVIRLGGHPFQVVGVAPDSFDGLTLLPGVATAVWVPLGATPLLSAPAAKLPTRDRRELTVIGRLAPGVAPGNAELEMGVLGRRLDAAYPITALTGADQSQRVVVARKWSARPASMITSVPDSRAGALLLCMVALVLVVACTNLANLMLARGTVRHHEFAVRRALGASRWRLVREQLAESAIVAALGGIVALAMMRVLLVLLTFDVPIPRGSFHFEPRLSLSALAVAVGALLLSLLVVGLEPALQLTQAGVSAHLASEAGTGGTPRTSRQRRLLRWQVAISACFFLIAAVLARAVIDQMRHDSGVPVEQLAIATVHPQAQGWDETRTRRAVDAALESARHDRAIQRVTASTGVPFGMTMTSWAHVTTPDKPFVPGPGHERDFGWVIAATPEIFATLGVPISRGRAFDYRDDAAAPRVMVVSEHTARAMFGTANAMGRQVMFRMWGWRPVETFTIVGVARDTDVQNFMLRDGNLMYVPLAQHYEPNLVIVARAADPAAAVGVLQAALRRADPDFATGTVGTGVQLLLSGYLVARIAALLAVGLGGLTLLMAMVGLYGIESHLVAWRTRELGVRVALGASAGHIEWMVLREGARPVVEGVVIGLLLGAIARLVIRAIVVAPIQVIDPIAFAVVPVPLFLAALVACYLPARRAAHVDPNVALRHL